MTAKYTFAEYFAGIGLVGLGLGSSGSQIRQRHRSQEARDVRPALATTKRYLVGDIYDVDPAEIPVTTLATASFPCIDLSLAGNRAGIKGKHSGAFWGFVHILGAMGEDGRRW